MLHELLQAPEAEQKKSGQAVTERRKTISALTSIQVFNIPPACARAVIVWFLILEMSQRKTGGGGEEINLERQFLVKFNLPGLY